MPPNADSTPRRRRPLEAAPAELEPVAERVRLVPLAELHPDPANPKTHDVAAIRASICEFGWFGAVVARRCPETGVLVLVAGHGRVEALRRLLGTRKWQQTGLPDGVVPCDVLPLGSEPGRRALLADNRTGQLGAVDTPRLAALLESLSSLTGTGYSAAHAEHVIASIRGESAASEARLREALEASPTQPPRETPMRAQVTPTIEEPEPRAITITFTEAEYPHVLAAMARAMERLRVRSYRDLLLTLLDAANED